MDKSEIEVVAELEPSAAPRVCILRHKPTGEVGVGCADSAHDARDKAVEMLLTKIENQPAHSCTRLSARWCPVHGDCTCPGANDGGSWYPVTHCPLHGDESDHPSDKAGYPEPEEA